MKEHKVRKSEVMEKPWVSPPRQQRESVLPPVEVIKQAAAPKLVQESGFMSRFSNNENYKNH